MPKEFSGGVKVTSLPGWWWWTVPNVGPSPAGARVVHIHRLGGTTSDAQYSQHSQGAVTTHKYTKKSSYYTKYRRKKEFIVQEGV